MKKCPRHSFDRFFKLPSPTSIQREAPIVRFVGEENEEEVEALPASSSVLPPILSPQSPRRKQDANSDYYYYSLIHAVYTE